MWATKILPVRIEFIMIWPIVFQVVHCVWRDEDPSSLWYEDSVNGGFFNTLTSCEAGTLLRAQNLWSYFRTGGKYRRLSLKTASIYGIAWIESNVSPWRAHFAILFDQITEDSLVSLISWNNFSWTSGWRERRYVQYAKAVLVVSYPANKKAKQFSITWRREIPFKHIFWHVCLKITFPGISSLFRSNWRTSTLSEEPPALRWS